MKKTNPLIASFLILLFLNSCGTVAEGLGGSKKKGSDEFLVEKKSPLVLPPSFGELPEPGKEPEENIISDKKDTSDIEDIINQSSSTSTSEKSDDTKNSIEQSIIKKINEKKVNLKEATEINLDETIEENEKPKKKGFFKRLKNKFNNLNIRKMIFKNFLNIKNSKIIKKDFLKLLKDQPALFETLKPTYKYSYSKKIVKKYKKLSNLRIIGMGGSVLGSEAIYDFLKPKIKKKITFVNNLNSNADYFDNKNINLNLIISKSGNTLETIANANALINKKEKNIIITEAKNSYLTNLAAKLKAEIFEHKNYVGGRYSVLSEVGMLPAELMNLNEKKFKQFNNLIKNKNFINNLVSNVSTTLSLIKSGKQTSIILNYDEQSENLFKWYQQLIAESLGKKSLRIITCCFFNAKR